MTSVDVQSSLGAARQRFARYFQPLPPVDVWEERVARRAGVHLRLVDAIGERQRRFEHARTADHGDLIDAAPDGAFARCFEGGYEVVGDNGAGRAIIGVCA